MDRKTPIHSMDARYWDSKEFHDRSVMTNLLVIVFPVKNLILYFIRGQFDSISWLTTSIFPTILLTYGRVLKIGYGPFNFREPGLVSHPTDKGRRSISVPTILQTLLPKGRPWSSASPQNLSQSVYHGLFHHHRYHIRCISNLLGVIVESSR